MKKSTTGSSVVHRTAKERRATAARTASWRDRNASAKLEVRDIDKVVCEALTLYARSLPAPQQKALLKTIVDLAVSGLAYQGHDAALARGRIIDRMSYWVGTELTSGTVRAVLDRKSEGTGGAVTT